MYPWTTPPTSWPTPPQPPPASSTWPQSTLSAHLFGQPSPLHPTWSSSSSLMPPASTTPSLTFASLAINFSFGLSYASVGFSSNVMATYITVGDYGINLASNPTVYNYAFKTARPPFVWPTTSPPFWATILQVHRLRHRLGHRRLLLQLH